MVPLCKYLDDIVNIFILFEIIAYFYTTIAVLYWYSYRILCQY